MPLPTMTWLSQRNGSGMNHCGKAAPEAGMDRNTKITSEGSAMKRPK
jgi:hypothetical protein